MDSEANSSRLLPRDIRLVQCRPQGFGEPYRIVVRPKMDVEAARLFVEHVTMDRGHFDT